MAKKYLLFILFAAAVFSCKKEATVPAPIIVTKPPIEVAKTDTAAILSATIELKNNKDKITSDIDLRINSNNEVIGVLPELTSKDKNLVVTFTTKSAGTVVKVNDVVQVSGTTINDFSKPITYTLTTPKGNSKTYKATVRNFTGIPILYITTSGPVVSKDVYVDGSMTVDGNQEYEQDTKPIALQMKGRGNSTWFNTDFKKKPYRLKFTNKAPMLGMPTAKNWVLLANYDDKTLMRNRIALELARRLKSDYASESRFVEVVMNGVFLGNYLLTSQVEVNENRVNITELKTTNTSASDITGGYLLELDYRLDADFYFRTKKNVPLTIKSPDAITPAQLAYIHGYMQDFEDALFSDKFTDPDVGYAKYINPDSFINWYITEETVRNQDSWDFSSIFYYKDRNGKLGMGPVWDFDLSGGNVDYTDSKNPIGFHSRNGLFMGRLFQDYAFRLKVKNRWDAMKAVEIKRIFADIDETAAYLQLSQKQNFAKWPILNQYVWPNAVVLGDYNLEVAYYKKFVQDRFNWLDEQISHY